MVNKELAVSLRKRGLTYDEIADQLGCSFGWCAKNLAGVKKDFGAEHPKQSEVTKDAAIAILKDALARLEKL
jgi:cyanate lyase